MRGSGLQETAQALGFAHSVTGVSMQASPCCQKLARPVCCTCWWSLVLQGQLRLAIPSSV